MLKVNINERISWEDYFNHSFFKQPLGKIEENYIICEYDIKKEELNKPIQILNCLNEESKKILDERYKEAGIKDYKLEKNDNEINKMNCELFLNNKKIDFCVKNNFNKVGKYELNILFK